MSDPTYQRVGSSGGKLHEMWDAEDQELPTDPDPNRIERLRASPTSVSARTDVEVSEVLKRFPRPGANAPVRRHGGGSVSSTAVVIGMVTLTSACTIGALYVMTTY